MTALKALELESDNFEQRNLEKHLDVDCGRKVEDAANDHNKRGSKGAEHHKRNPQSPKEALRAGMVGSCKVAASPDCRQGKRQQGQEFPQI
jgi:hypothetical protein